MTKLKLLFFILFFNFSISNYCFSKKINIYWFYEKNKFYIELVNNFIINLDSDNFSIFFKENIPKYPKGSTPPNSIKNTYGLFYYLEKENLIAVASIQEQDNEIFILSQKDLLQINPKLINELNKQIWLKDSTDQEPEYLGMRLIFFTNISFDFFIKNKLKLIHKKTVDYCII